jgi:hypothetical protein
LVSELMASWLMMSARTLGVAVAVSAMNGTPECEEWNQPWQLGDQRPFLKIVKFEHNLTRGNGFKEYLHEVTDSRVASCHVHIRSNPICVMAVARHREHGATWKALFV